MEQTLYSLRMRASRNGQHLTGAERIVPLEQVCEVSARLIERAIQRGAPDDIHCHIESLDPANVLLCALPDLSTLQVPDWQTGRTAARQRLQKAGVSLKAADHAIRLLTDGPVPGGRVMRGAMLIDAASGERLETDLARGVRVSRMDLAPSMSDRLMAKLNLHGLGHHRVREALVLAGKVLSAPGVLAELCWSDDPAYLTGYVAEPVSGYQRILPLKAQGDPRGGRAFFIDRQHCELNRLCHYLEKQVVLFDAMGAIYPPAAWKATE